MVADRDKPDTSPGNPKPDDAIRDEGWAQVDLHERKKTPEADLPSDIQSDDGEA